MDTEDRESEEPQPPNSPEGVPPELDRMVDSVLKYALSRKAQKNQKVRRKEHASKEDQENQTH